MKRYWIEYFVQFGNFSNGNITATVGFLDEAAIKAIKQDIYTKHILPNNLNVGIPQQAIVITAFIPLDK
jgi:hypothetical protein